MPHPVIDPKGHSYGKKPPRLKYQPSEEWSRNEEYLFGIDLYNDQFWWEAHEAWEAVWQTTQKTDDQGRFLQGLIQISAVMIKWWTKNKTGMKKLFQEGRLKLNSLSENRFMGTGLKVFLKDLEQFESDPKEENYPLIELS